jgi:hypothetical protein
MSNPFGSFKPRAAGVPIVGLPMTPHFGHVMATYTCRCDPTNSPSMIRGHDIIDMCVRCRALYGIVAVRFDRRAGQGLQVEIGHVGYAPEQPAAAEPASEIEVH